MKTKKHWSLLLMAVVINSLLFAQIRWEVVKEDTTLTPSSYECKGTVDIHLGGKKGNAFSPVSGEITIDFSDKAIYLSDGKDIFRLKNDIIEDLKIDGFRNFNGDVLFEKEFNDSLLNYYRENLYPSLNLNQIQFSSSKRVEYTFEDNDLVLKNQKISKGKICYVSPTNIVIIHDNGEMDDFKDGDFNFLQVGSFKAFKCKQLYNFIYENFRNNLSESIRKWEYQIKKSSIDSIMSVYGPMDNITTISSDRKMITWRKENSAYQVNMNTFNRSAVSTFQNSTTNIISNKMSSLYGISPFFLFGNSYRTTVVNYSGNGLAMAASQTSQSGIIRKLDEGLFLTIIEDAGNKIIAVYHQNIFTEPGYGQPFRFISF